MALERTGALQSLLIEGCLGHQSPGALAIREVVAGGLHGGGNPMATARLRLFPQPEDQVDDEPNAPAMPIRLADLYPLLAQAYRDNYVWLRDFESDQLLVSHDLYEVVRAFADCRPSA